MSISVAATMARGIAVVLLIMFLFRRPVVQRLFLNTLPLSRSEIKKSSRVKSVDQGSQSFFGCRLVPRETVYFFQASVKYMTCCSTLLKMTKCRLPAIHQISRFVKNVEVEFNVDGHVKENKASCVSM
jgi:hypothetical protein